MRRLCAVALSCASALFGAGTVVRFDPASPSIGPFPSDALTVADPAQKTGRRVNLPLPDCAAQPSSCEELGFLNQLDGFGLQPRIRVRFSGPINPDTLRAGLGFVWLDNLTADEFGLQPAGHVTPVNQVIYDPETNTAYAKPDEFFDQHRRYALVVTGAVKDRAGDPVKADPAYQNCVALGSSDYCRSLAQAVSQRPNIVSASVFTTMSATDFLEKVRAALPDTNPGVQSFGSRSVFNLDDIAALTVRYQRTADDSKLSDLAIPPSVLAGVGRIAFGSYQSPVFFNERYIIPATPTGMAIAAPVAATRIYFHAFLPKTPKPDAGYPVVIVGHGFGDDSFGVSSQTAATFARAGFASIAINMFGHGYGPGSKVSITDKTGTTIDIPTGGRGVPLSEGGSYGSFDGCVLPGLFGARDCLRQTTVDLMQLVRAIGAGIDLDGDAAADLDQDRIYYAGHSFGAMYGTMLTAVEPNLAAAALNSGGGTLTDITRTSQSFHALGILILGGRTPSLLNKGSDFDDGSVLRYRPVRVEDVPGAIAVQEFLDLTEWYGAPGDAIAYAPHLVSSTLPGVPVKPVLFQYGAGDRVVPNPAETNLVRAANMRENTRYLRYDLARTAAPQLPSSPHSAISGMNSPAELAIAGAIQQQIAGFLASGGTAIPDGNDLVRPLFGKDLFETPAFLTEDFNFIP